MSLYLPRDIYEIHQLKARYCRFTDTKQWPQFAELLTEDFYAHFEGSPRLSKSDPTDIEMFGRELIVPRGEFLKDVITIHQVYMPEITILTCDTAKGIWAMRDYLRLATCIFTGYGHYHEDYVKKDERWYIKRLNVTRLYVEEVWF